jgi:hypothetical protein
MISILTILTSAIQLNCTRSDDETTASSMTQLRIFNHLRVQTEQTIPQHPTHPNPHSILPVAGSGSPLVALVATTLILEHSIINVLAIRLSTTK